VNKISRSTSKRAKPTTRIEIVKTGPACGAEVRGADLTKPLGNADFKIIHDALMEHEVIVLPDQQAITVEDQVRFGERFGKLSVHPFSPHAKDVPELIVLDNDGDKPPLAASELQKLVKSTAQETGVEVRSERILPTTERGGYVEVPVEVTLSGPVRAVVLFLQRLEAVPVQVSVQDFKLRVVSVAAPRELLATLAVTGYIVSSTAGEGESRGRSEPRRGPGA